MASPTDILRTAFERVSSDVSKPIITVPDVRNRIEVVCRSASNRACVRVVLACSLAKAHNPEIDIRKPYHYHHRGD